jgi:hypothetical protein
VDRSACVDGITVSGLNSSDSASISDYGHGLRWSALRYHLRRPRSSRLGAEIQEVCFAFDMPLERNPLNPPFIPTVKSKGLGMRQLPESTKLRLVCDCHSQRTGVIST